MTMPADNSLEDYWEDASVSWGCRGLSFPSCFHSPPHQAHTEDSMDNKPSYMQDFTSTLRPRKFPPPIALCTTLSIKAGGRFVLKEMSSLPPHGLRAEREQGRLCLHLIEPKEVYEDEEDDNDNDNYTNVCNVEDTSVCADLHRQEQQEGYKALATEDINVSIIGIQGMLQEPASEGGKAVVAETEDMPEKHAHAEQALTKECNDGNNDVKPSTSEKHAMEHIETRDISIGASMLSTVHASEIEIKNGSGADMGVLGIGEHQRSSLWSKEGINDIAASLSPCSSKQVLPHRSFARTSPALGLTVS